MGPDAAHGHDWPGILPRVRAMRATGRNVASIASGRKNRCSPRKLKGCVVSRWTPQVTSRGRRSNGERYCRFVATGDVDAWPLCEVAVRPTPTRVLESRDR